MPGLRPCLWRPDRSWRLRPNYYKAGRTPPTGASREERFDKAMHNMLERMNMSSLLAVEGKLVAYASCLRADSSHHRDEASLIKDISQAMSSLSAGDRSGFERFIAMKRFMDGARSRAEGRDVTRQPATVEDLGAERPPAATAEAGGAERPPATAEDSSAGLLPAEGKNAERPPATTAEDLGAEKPPAATAEAGGAEQPPATAEDSSAGLLPAEGKNAERPPVTTAEDSSAGLLLAKGDNTERPPTTTAKGRNAELPPATNAKGGGAGLPPGADDGAVRKTVTTAEDGGAGRPSPTILGNPWVVASSMLGAASSGGHFPTVAAVKSSMVAGERPPTSISPEIKMEDPKGKGKGRRKGKGKGKGKRKK